MLLLFHVPFSTSEHFSFLLFVLFVFLLSQRLGSPAGTVFFTNVFIVCHIYYCCSVSVYFFHFRAHAIKTCVNVVVASEPECV